MADISSILTHVAPSIDPLMRFFTGGSYLLAIWFMWLAIKKLRDVADQRARYGGGGKVFIPLAYGMGGLVLFYLPTFVQVGQNSLFGLGSPLEYISWLAELKHKYGDSIFILIKMIQLAGVIWVVRGVVLLVQASEPGVQHGPKGAAFMVAGIFAINVKATTEMVNHIMAAIASSTM